MVTKKTNTESNTTLILRTVDLFFIVQCCFDYYRFRTVYSTMINIANLKFMKFSL